MSEQNCSTPSLQATGLWLGLGFGAVTSLAVLSAIFPDSGLRSFFSSACHQQSGRSHHIDGIPFGVCVRCFWLYAGLAAAHLRFTLFQTIPTWRRPFLVITAVLAGMSWVAGWLGIAGDVVLLRAATSVLFAVAVSHYTVPGITEWIFPGQRSTHNLTKPHGLKHT